METSPPKLTPRAIVGRPLPAVQSRRLDEEVRASVGLGQDQFPGAQFRSWFHENCRTDPEHTVREHRSLLRSIPFIESATGRTLRFFAQVGVGGAMLPFDPLLGLAAGATASAIDTYLVGRLLRGASPKIFLEKLDGLTAKDEIPKK